MNNNIEVTITIMLKKKKIFPPSARKRGLAATAIQAAWRGLCLRASTGRWHCNKSGCNGGQAFQGETDGLLYCSPACAGWSGSEYDEEDCDSDDEDDDEDCECDGDSYDEFGTEMCKKCNCPHSNEYERRGVGACYSGMGRWTSDVAKKKQIAFSCFNCDRDIIRDSFEHDHSCCHQDNEDMWFCPDCVKYKGSDSDDDDSDEECEMCEKKFSKEDKYVRKGYTGVCLNWSCSIPDCEGCGHVFCSEECFKGFRLCGDKFLCPHREDTCIGSSYNMDDVCDCDEPTKEDYEKYCFEDCIHPWPETYCPDC